MHAARIGEEVPLAEGDLEWLFLHWFDEVVPGLNADLSAFLNEQRVAPSAEDPEYLRRQGLWNVLGYLAATLGHTRLAVELFQSLLQVLRGAQRALDRLHKGTPYHQIGWSRLVGDEPPESAKDYFLLAAFEDLMTYQQPQSGFPTTPALIVLRQTYGYSDEALGDLVAALDMVRNEDNDVLRRTALLNPELILLEMVPRVMVRRRA